MRAFRSLRSQFLNEKSEDRRRSLFDPRGQKELREAAGDFWRERSHFTGPDPGFRIVFGQLAQIKPTEDGHRLGLQARRGGLGPLSRSKTIRPPAFRRR